MSKSSTVANYQSRLNRVVEFLYQHLDDELRIEDLAEVAHLSPYHWHRIYTAMQGETVAVTIKRLRLERAANSLANSSTSVSDIALAARYSSTEAFSRAFKDRYLQSPAAYRIAGSHNEYKNANLLKDSTRFDVQIRPLHLNACASVPHRGSYMQINHAMGTLMGALAEQGLMSNATRMLAIFEDDPEITPQEHLSSAACVPIEAATQLSSPLVRTELYSGDYAMLRYVGPYADMQDAYQWLYGVWLPASGREAADAPNVEEYLNNPQEVAPTELETMMCLPLRSENTSLGESK